ncbi:MAG: hypothetical protein QXQ81_00980 [Candidatus Thorarchaeota archaeon]
MRTHLIEEAEKLGQGEVTHGSAMLAVERFGDPRDVANEYARLGRKMGPIPSEYVVAVLRTMIILVAVGFAFLMGSYVVGIALSAYLPEALPFVPYLWYAVLGIAVLGILYAVVTVGRIRLLHKNRPPSEKTALEEILGVGVEAFQPSSRLDILFECALCAVMASILALPRIQSLFASAFLLPLNFIVALLVLSAIIRLVQFRIGENNVILLLTALTSAAWVLLSFVLINFRFPLQYLMVTYDGIVMIIPLDSLVVMEPVLSVVFATIWIGIVFIIVMTSVWDMMLSAAKMTMYMKQGRTWWWRGTWGPDRVFGKHIPPRESTRPDAETL